MGQIIKRSKLYKGQGWVFAHVLTLYAPHTIITLETEFCSDSGTANKIPADIKSIDKLIDRQRNMWTAEHSQRIFKMKMNTGKQPIDCGWHEYVYYYYEFHHICFVQESMWANGRSKFQVSWKFGIFSMIRTHNKSDCDLCGSTLTIAILLQLFKKKSIERLNETKKWKFGKYIKITRSRATARVKEWVSVLFVCVSGNDESLLQKFTFRCFQLNWITTESDYNTSIVVRRNRINDPE